MAEVVTFLRYRPPARFDSLPWTEVRVEEATTEDGVYTLIDTIALDPLDADPSDPAYRSFTTELATDEELWYRIKFADASGDVSQPTTPIQNVIVPDVLVYATTTELARILKIRNPTDEQLAAMERVLIAAAGEIDAELGRSNDLSGWELYLAADVNLDRAQEHWQQEQVPFGILPIGEFGARISSDTWKRHAEKLAPLKGSWGIA